MSSRAVRRQVDTWMGLMTLPYYPTVNLEQDPTDNTWVTVDYNIPFKNKLTFCGDTLEEGTFTVAFFGQPGIGDDQLLQAAESDIAILMNQVDTTGVIRLLSFSPPIDFRQDEWYIIEFTIDYEYYSA